MMRRFLRYADKVFDIGQALGTLGDARMEPRIPTGAIWMSALVMFLTRRGSLNGIEKELRMPRRLDGLVGGSKPSADTIGAVYALMDSEPLRAYLCRINHRLKRNKALPRALPLRFAAIDGHEFFSQ
jgi:hypothetical protein